MHLSSARGMLIFYISFLRLSSTDIEVALTHLFMLVIMHLVFITLIFLASALWPSDPCPAVAPCIHDHLSSHCTATVDPTGKNIFMIINIFTCLGLSVY